VTVTPRWPGGNKAAAVELEVLQTDMVARGNSDCPASAATSSAAR
jgi:hypothetical protein